MEHVVNIISGLCTRPERFRIHMSGVTYPDRSYHIVRGCSDIYCIEYVLEGAGDVACGDRHVYPHAGDAYILPPGVRHDYRSSPTDPYKKIWMNVSGLLCDALYREYHLGDAVIYPQTPVRSVFEEFLALCERGTRANMRPSDFSREGALLVHDLFARLAAQHLDEALSVSSVIDASTIRDYLDRRVEDNVRLAEVSRDLGLSVSQLSRLFVQAYGVSPYRYYLRQRMDLACSLLNNTGMRIREIAARLHCVDAHYFSTQFKSSMGMSPRRYREQTSGQR